MQQQFSRELERSRKRSDGSAASGASPHLAYAVCISYVKEEQREGVCRTGKERAELGSRTPRASNVGHERIFSIAVLLQRVVGTRYAMSGIPQKSSRTK
jgi:hypothetical protein